MPLLQNSEHDARIPPIPVDRHSESVGQAAHTSFQPVRPQPALSCRVRPLAVLRVMMHAR